MLACASVHTCSEWHALVFTRLLVQLGQRQPCMERGLLPTGIALMSGED